MDIELVIAQMRTYAPVFAQRVAGAAEFKALSEKTAFPMPAAWVIPLEDSPERPKSLNAVRQDLAESFAVIVCIDNAVDERGQAAVITLHTVRAAVWRALLGWRPTLGHNGVYYDGGTLLQMDRAQLWYQFDFAADMQIGPSDGWEETMLEGLPALNTVHVKTDVIDPIVDKSLAPAGPDGRIEFESDISNLNL
ncbi:hypothetical protein RD110_18635 [Rhodoferax koreense]|uniref:Phage tail protein n=1 Tax=Rhodoferax koreensis TaxID=1842727 RepID=A0A1P8JYY9_9BURK|nr:hypothetical protein [Rhodoferax koreense]APW38972.1 hypothetical protein RD110_18635 [Rhodoferax koreense]